MRESLRKENSPLKKLGKVHHTVKWQKKYFITFGLLLQKAKKNWEKITCVMFFSKFLGQNLPFVILNQKL